MKILNATILSFGLITAGFFIGHGLTTIKNHEHYVTVKGLAEKNVVADEAIWKLNFGYASDTQEDLYKGMKQAHDQIIAFLKQEGFAENEIETQAITIVDHASESYGNSNSNQKRFSESGGVTILSHDIPKVNNAIQHTQELLKNKVILKSSSVDYRFTKLNDIKPEMIDTATQNAQHAAQQFAKNSHSKLGKIRFASQGQFSISSADGSYGNSNPNKRVRVVTTVEYSLT